MIGFLAVYLALVFSKTETNDVDFSKVETKRTLNEKEIVA